MSCKSQFSGQHQGQQSSARATREMQAELGMLAQSIGEQGLAELRSKIKRSEQLSLTVDQIIRLITAGVELGRVHTTSILSE